MQRRTEKNHLALLFPQKYATFLHASVWYNFVHIYIKFIHIYERILGVLLLPVIIAEAVIDDNEIYQVYHQ